jgi:hypothetical protein
MGCGGGGSSSPGTPGNGGNGGGNGGGNNGVASGTVIVFDFDTAVPQLPVGSSLPFSQSKGGLTADFSDTTRANGYSVQSAASTSYVLSQFSGNFLLPNGLAPGALNIQFGQAVRRISIVFATADFNQVEVPTTVMLTAYNGTTASVPVGSVQAHGVYAADTMPMGTITFDSGGAAFSLVVLSIPPQIAGATDCLVDNITVTVQ